MDEITTAPVHATIEDMLGRIAELKVEEAKLKPIKAEIDELRYSIQLAMRATKTKSTEAVNGFMAVRKITRSLQIDNEGALAEWLEENTMDSQAYYKIDVAGIKTLAEERLRDFGELLPGVSQVETETVAITPVKGSK